MSSRSLQCATMACLLGVSAQVGAQEALEAQQGEPPDRIDIRVEPQTDEQGYEDCEDDQDAATITGEIIVCRERSGGENRLYDDDTAKNRHAERTQNHNEIPAPDVAGAGIFRGPPTISGLCFIPPCPKDPAYLIDFDDLPDAPPGSDADRIARGLAPRGNDEGIIAEDISEEELGLPPPPADSDGEAISPSESASPAEEPTG